MITAQQVKMARAALGFGVRELAEQTGLTANTISRFENKGSANSQTVDAIQTALEAKGVQFIDSGASSESGGAGVRLKT